MRQTEGPISTELPLDLPGERQPIWLRTSLSLWAALFMALLVAVVAAALVWREQQDRDTQALREADLYAQMLADHANRTFDAVDVTLKSLAESLSAEVQPTAQAALLANAVRALPFMRSVSVMDANGAVRLSSNPGNVGVQLPESMAKAGVTGQRVTALPLLPGRDLSDQDQRQGQELSQAQRRFIPVVLRLGAGTALGGDADEGGGTLVAALNPDYFANSHERLLQDTGYAAALLHLDGTLMSATESIALAAGTRAPQHRMFRDFLPAREFGSFIDRGLDGAVTVSAFRSARQAPWLLLLEMPYASVQAEHQALFRQAALAVLAIWALIALLTLLIWRSLRAYAQERQQRAQATKLLHEQAGLTARLLEASPSPLFMVDRQGQVLQLNRACCDFMGWQRDATIGQPLAQLCPDLHQALAGRSDWVKSLSAVQATSLSYGRELTLPAPVGRTDGLKDAPATRSVMLYATVFSDAAGRELGLIGSLVDVSHFREVERRTLEAKQAAEAASEAKTEFMANMSHELRTPLQSIIGFSELGITRFTDHPKAQQTLQRIHDAGQRMLALVNNLLDLSRTDLLHARMDLQCQDVLPLVRHVMQELQPQADKGRVNLQWESDDAPLLAAVDAFALQQVVRNVLANALRFAPAASTVTVSALADAAAGQVQIRVVDQGPGIPPAELEAIFQPFVQSTRTKDGSGGTGLGLAICRRILDAHRGSIQAGNRPEGGAVFVITLPMSAPTSAPPTGAATAAPTIPSETA